MKRFGITAAPFLSHVRTLQLSIHSVCGRKFDPNLYFWCVWPLNLHTTNKKITHKNTGWRLDLRSIHATFCREICSFCFCLKQRSRIKLITAFKYKAALMGDVTLPIYFDLRAKKWEENNNKTWNCLFLLWKCLQFIFDARQPSSCALNWIVQIFSSWIKNT